MDNKKLRNRLILCGGVCILFVWGMTESTKFLERQEKSSIVTWNGDRILEGFHNDYDYLDEVLEGFQNDNDYLDEILEAFDNDYDYSGYNTSGYFNGGNKSKESKASKVYSDDSLIAKEDYSTGFLCFNYYSDDEGMSIGKFKLIGSNTILIADVNTDTTLNLDYEVGRVDGKLKLCLISPDGKVTTLKEGAGTYKKEVNLKKGRNCLKLVGVTEWAKDIDITFKKPNKSLINGWFTSEDEEMAQKIIDQVNKGIKIDMAEFIKAAPYMEESDVSRALIYVLKTGNISDSQLRSIIPFADDDFSDALIQYVKQGKKILTAKQLTDIAPFLTEECIDEIILQIVNNKGSISKSELNNLLPFASEEALGKLVKTMIQKGTDFKPGDLQNIAPFLDEDILDELIDDLIKSKYSFSSNVITDLAPFLDEDTLRKAVTAQVESSPKDAMKTIRNVAYNMDSEDIAACMKKIIDKGYKIDIYNIRDIACFMDEEDVEYLVKLMLKKDLITKKEVEDYYWYYD